VGEPGVVVVVVVGGEVVVVVGGEVVVVVGGGDEHTGTLGSKNGVPLKLPEVLPLL
jgi:hypothetical protein